MTIEVKVKRPNGSVEAFVLSRNATVEDLCDVAGIDIDDESLSFELRRASGLLEEETYVDDELANGDTLELSLVRVESSDGMVTVRVGRVPGQLKEIRVPAHSTVASVLSAAGVVCGSTDSISIKGSIVNASATVREGDLVTVSAKIKGN